MSLIAGIIIAIFLHYITGWKWGLVALFWILALPLQVSYTHSVNRYLGGADPVAHGIKSFGQLKAVANVPFSIKAINFIARTFWWAGLMAVLISFDIFGISKF